MIIANLCAPGVAVRATAYGERKATPQTWAVGRGAQAAINGDFFNFPAATYVVGRARGGGDDWPEGTQASENVHFFEFGSGFAEWVSPGLSLPTSNATDIIGSHNPVIVGGASYVDGNLPDNRPRSAVGLNEARTRLYLFASKDAINGDDITAAMFAMSSEATGGKPDIDIAMAVDGGGSTQMYVEGQGQIIDSGRLVANHLGIFASGSGDSPQCPSQHYPPAVRRSNVDIDGDGTGDICARYYDGVTCAIIKNGQVAREIKGPAWSHSDGWGHPGYRNSVQFADVNGDGKADVCGRASDGVHCVLSDGAAFTTEIPGPALTDDSGWGARQFFTTIQYPDVNGDGKADVCARSSADVSCWLSDGAAFPTKITGPAWSNASGWHYVEYYTSIQFPDLNGDGKADVCGRNSIGVQCFLSDGAGFPTSVPGPTWTNDAGWLVASTGSTLRYVDLNGDKKADLCGRSAAGIRCVLSTGTGFGPEIVGPEWSDANGWNKPEYFETIQYADFNSDGKADICGRNGGGVVCHMFDGTAFGPQIVGPAWSDASGWNKPQYFRTIGAMDINHDGRDDLCARNADGMLCAPSNGKGFEAPIPGPAWADGKGWDNGVYYSSIRYVGVPVPVAYKDDETPGGKPSTPGGSDDDDGGGNVEASGCAATDGRARAASGMAAMLVTLGVLIVRRRRG